MAVCHVTNKLQAWLDPGVYMAAAETFLSLFLGSMSCFDFTLKQAPLTPWRAGLQLQVSTLQFLDPNGRKGSLPGHCNKMLGIDTRGSGLVTCSSLDALLWPKG